MLGTKNKNEKKRNILLNWMMGIDGENMGRKLSKATLILGDIASPPHFDCIYRTSHDCYDCPELVKSLSPKEMLNFFIFIAQITYTTLCNIGLINLVLCWKNNADACLYHAQELLQMYNPRLQCAEARGEGFNRS